MSMIKYSWFRSGQWFYRIGAYLLLGSIPLLRKGSGEGEKQIRIPHGIQWERVIADGISTEWMVPPNAQHNSVLLFLHGGGGVTGLYNTHRWLIGHIALSCGIRALLPDYRLAPEHPFPSGLEDCVSAYRWLLSEGYQPQNIVVAGDSLGGMLTISLLLALRQTNQPLPVAAVCISPNTDPTSRGKTMRTNAWKDALLSPKYTQTMMKLYVHGHDVNDPLIAPLHADLSGLPPILIQAGADEILLDDSMRFAERAKTAGTKVILEVWPHMWHDWHVCVPNLPEANQAIDHIAKFVQSHIIF
jgi:epsilon-lactone hydrolase